MNNSYNDILKFNIDTLNDYIFALKRLKYIEENKEKINYKYIDLLISEIEKVTALIRLNKRYL